MSTEACVPQAIKLNVEIERKLFKREHRLERTILKWLLRGYKQFSISIKGLLQALSVLDCSAIPGDRGGESENSRFHTWGARVIAQH